MLIGYPESKTPPRRKKIKTRNKTRSTRSSGTLAAVSDADKSIEQQKRQT